MADHLDKAICGALWIEKIIKADGRIIYGYNDYTLKKTKGYNILRHAGSIWAMLSVYEYIPHTKLLESGLLSLQYIKDEYSGKSNNLDVIHEDGWIKLGGNGLVSLAMMQCYKMIVRDAKYLKDSSIDLDNIQWLLDFGTSLLAYTLHCIDPETKLFTHHKRNVNTGADKGFISSFYPGEALLAIINGMQFVRPDDCQTDSIFIDKILQTITAYFVKCETEGHVRDHWMMQAIEKIAPMTDQETKTTILLPYATAIMDKTVMDSPSKSAGASAARSESLLSYVRFMRDNFTASGQGLENLLTIIKNQLDFQETCYISRGLSTGAFRAKPSSNECRCDCTQHNISAFLGYHKLTKELPVK